MEGSDFNFIDLLANGDVTALEEAQKAMGIVGVNVVG